MLSWLALCNRESNVALGIIVYIIWYEKIDLDDQKLNEAPIYSPVRKLDETKANRELDVRYIDDKS